ncbi:MAG: hypothetical protein FWF71_03385 [Actinomycetia bacterium]|nr:hypothetical protein [Actinomycetes bacterium]
MLEDQNGGISEPNQAAASLVAAASVGALAAFNSHIAGSALADVLLIKGDMGATELAGGAPFSGVDGDALRAALKALGWGDDNWCGLTLTALAADGAEPQQLSPKELRFVVEHSDPLLIVVLDAKAKQTLEQAFEDTNQDLPKKWLLGKESRVMRRRLLSVDNFEASLANECDKRRVWVQLKRGTRQPSPDG